MPGDAVGGGEKQGSGQESNSRLKEGEEGDKGSASCSREEQERSSAAAPQLLSIVVSQPEEISLPSDGFSENASFANRNDENAAALKKGFFPRSESYQELCRVCQQETEEILMDLGCRCRGELSKAHKSCIDIWFRTRGSNTCEICQQVASNVPFPEVQPIANNWIWRADPASNIGQRERERGCFSPIWVAFSILIGGLLLDVFISVSLGVSALPVNVIVGVLIVLGLGTALRLMLECCQEWNSRRNFQANDTATVNLAYPATM